MGRFFTAIRNPTVRRVILKALFKNLMISALILGPGIWLMSIGQTIPGIVWLFCGSFGQMAWTYRKPWRLGWLSCLLPPVATGLAYLVQLAFFGGSPPIIWLLPVIAMGIFIGISRGNAHEIYQEDGAIFARKTLLFLGIWAVAYGVTQGLSMYSRNGLAIRSGLLTGAFSTAMLATVSIILFRRWRALKPGISAALAFIFVSISFAAAPDVAAQDSCSSAVDKIHRSVAPFYLDQGGLIVREEDLGADFANAAFDSNDFNYPVEVCGKYIIYNINQLEFSLSIYGVRARSSNNASDMINRSFKLPFSFGLRNNIGHRPNIGVQSFQDFILAGYRGKYQFSNTYASPAHGDRNRLLAGLQIAAVKGDTVFYTHMVGKNSIGAYTQMDRLMTDQKYLDHLGAGLNSVSLSSGVIPPRPPQPVPSVSKEQTAAMIGIVAVLLMGAGVTINIIQSISISIINAIQSGVELTADDLANMVDWGIDQEKARNPYQAFDYNREGARSKSGNAPPNVRSRDRIFPTSDATRSEPNAPNWDDLPNSDDSAFDYSREAAARGNNAPPNVQSSERFRPPTPDREQAEEAAALREEARRRQEEIEAHNRAAQENMDRDRRKRQEGYARERAEEATERYRREQTFADMESTERAAMNRDDWEILTRTDSHHMYNEDGSLNEEYIDKLRRTMRNRIGHDMATTDPDFDDNSWTRIIREGSSDTVEDYSNSLIVRMGAGVATGGMSEGFFQGRETWNAIEQAAHDAEDQGKVLSRTDVVRKVASKFAADNLPVNTYNVLTRIQKGEKVSWTEVGANLMADAFALLDVSDTVTTKTGFKPGNAVANAAQRTLPENVYNSGANALNRGRLEVESRIGQLGQIIDKADTKGTNWLNQKLGRSTGSTRLTAAQAEELINSGAVRADTQGFINNVNGAPDLKTSELNEAFQQGRVRGQQRIENFQNSVQNLDDAKSGGKASRAEIEALERDVRNNLTRIQSDKHAMNELNGLRGKAKGHPTIEAFNGELDRIYADVDQRTINRLAEEYGVRPEDVQIVTITNSGGERIVVDPSNPGRPKEGGHVSNWKEDGAIDGSKAARSEPGTIDGPETGRQPDPISPKAGDKPQNPRADKVGMDRDLTIRVRTREVVRMDSKTGKVLETRIVYRDIPSSTTGRIYNEEFFEVATGKTLTDKSGPKGAGRPTDFKTTKLNAHDMTVDVLDMQDPHKFARRMDQATTDRLHPEAYGTGQADLNVATKDPHRGVDLTDASGVAKTIEFKVNHWMNESDHFQELAKSADSPAIKQEMMEQAAAHMEEGQRQLHKQYKNMAIKRTGAMQTALNAHGARIPRELAERMNVLDKVFNGNPRLTPAQAEAVLGKMGTNTRQLSGQLSAYVEGLQSLRSPSSNRPSVAFQGWQDEFQQDQ